ncbi:hypothetical protein HMPREF3039_00914 [Akkermansia sp. KLE1798]|nr:hypothetical protein HMPREF3039_00914 [Akkermansia sp. KLE1798]KZA06156.1 hypothetical protein HMPREF1326_00004 [Akkermansia sp. KLE1605]
MMASERNVVYLLGGKSLRKELFVVSRSLRHFLKKFCFLCGV